MNVKTKIKLLLVCVAISSVLYSPCAERESWEYLMDFQKPKNAVEQEAWALLKECRHQGSEGARRLIAEMPRIPHKYRAQALEVLALTHAPEAREYLLSLALSTTDETAALKYIYKSGAPSAARNLLQSTNHEIQTIAVRGLLDAHRDGAIPLDRRAWEVVKGLLSAESLEVRKAAAMVAGRDSGTEVPAVEKAQALVRALEGIETLPEAQKQTAYGVHTFLRGARYEFACLIVVNALSELRGLEEEFLRRQPADTEVLVRDCMLLALGRRGDEHAKEGLRRLVQQHPSAAFRWEALGAFFKLGTTEDLPWLQELAERDPFYIAKWLPGKIESRDGDIPRDYYSVRERAREVMKAIEKRAAGAPTSSDKAAEK